LAKKALSLESAFSVPVKLEGNDELRPKSFSLEVFVIIIFILQIKVLNTGNHVLCWRRLRRNENEFES